MGQIDKLHDTLFKYGYFYDPLFVENYIIDINEKSMIDYDEKSDLLYLNAKVKNGRNYYKEFVKKNYKNFFDQKVYEKYKKMLSGILEVASDYENRYFGFAVRVPLEVLVKKNNIPVDIEKVNDTTLFNVLDEKIFNSIHMCSDIVKNGIKSEYFDRCYEKLSSDFKNTGITKENLKDPMLLTPLFMKLRQEYVDDYTLLHNLGEISNNIIKSEDFFNCFDIDKFSLLFGKIMLDKSIEFSKSSDDIPDIIPQVYNYIYFVDELGLKNYNPKIVIPKGNKKKQKLVYYTFNDLKRELNKYLENHPNFSFKYVSIYDPIFDDDIDNMKKAEMEKEAIKYRYGEKYQNITASWEFIKKGEVEKRFNSIRSNLSEKKEREEIDIDYRLGVFNKTDYLCQIVGTDKFQGYVGYIYPNGIIAFERFYDENNRPIKDNNATYIMNVDNFEYFSSLTKPEIIEYIKDMGNEEIDRKYHSLNWEKNIRKIVESNNYLEELKEKVKVIIAEGRKAKKLTL